MMKQNKRCLIIAILICSLNVYGQSSDSLKNKRLKPLIIGSTVAYTGALIGLNTLWYDDFQRESFHFFDDHKEWKQMDKIGHFYSAFHISHGSYTALKWSGVNEKKSILWGAIVSAVVLTPIEIFDGFSAGYGASYSDIIANTAGASLFYIQERAWGKIKVHPKFSFKRTELSSQRPSLLGDNYREEVLKDYNGQTYWLSFDISKLLNNNFPKWLNIAVGYGADNMVAANANQSQELGYDPYRQYFLAIDFDFNEYKTRSKVFNTFLYFVNMIHLPAPSLEYGKKLKFHLAYY